MKFESVRIHFLSDVSGLLLSRNFAWQSDVTTSPLYMMFLSAAHPSTCQYRVTTDSVFTTVYLFFFIYLPNLYVYNGLELV